MADNKTENDFWDQCICGLRRELWIILNTISTNWFVKNPFQVPGLLYVSNIFHGVITVGPAISRAEADSFEQTVIAPVTEDQIEIAREVYGAMLKAVLS